MRRRVLIYNCCIAILLAVVLATPSCAANVSTASSSSIVHIATKKVTVGKSAVTVHIATLPPNGWRPMLALGNDRVGGVEDLGHMAKRLSAVLAVNGTFFNPEDYAKSNRLPTEPYGTLIRNNNVLHVGNRGGIIGFTASSKPMIVPLRVSIEGGSAGSYSWPHNWYTYGFNHTPSGPSTNAAYIYTPERGPKVGFTYGAKVVVSQGIVTSIVQDKDVEIPRDGFVIGLTGNEGSQLLSRFAVGLAVEYRVKMLGPDKSPLQVPALSVAVGAGPILISNGRVLADHAEQGFAGDKILTQRGRRTAIGIKQDGSLIVAIADNLYVREMATVMQALGAKDALNLDGGASSGMWANDKYIISPGRRLSNVLVFVVDSR